MLTSGFQLPATRALIGLQKTKLADITGLSVTTIRMIDKVGAGPVVWRSSNDRVVQRVLQGAEANHFDRGAPWVRPEFIAPMVAEA